MNILLVGGSNNFMNAIIDKLNKEGHRTYVLTGDTSKKQTYRKVFEEYNFAYDNNNLNEIFDSVNPDIVLFMGAFDSNFEWSVKKRDSVEYSSGILNMLMAFSMLEGNHRFVYLSSSEVFQKSYAVDIKEDELPTPKDVRGMAVALGEQMCRNYREATGKDIITLRLDNVYEIPEDREGVTDACSKLCLQAMRDGRIIADDNKQFSLLYISDAVEFVYKLIICREHERQVYNISAMTEISEKDLALMVQRAMGEGVTIIDNTSDAVDRVILSANAYDEEFRIHIFHTPQKVVPKMATYMKKNSDKFLEKEEAPAGFWTALYRRSKVIVDAAIPYLENLIGFIPFFILNNQAADSRFFANVDFFLLYVLLFAIVYGQQQATFAAILAVVGYCYRQMYARSGLEVMMDYNTYVWIAQLFIVGLVVGYMRDQINLVREEDKKQLDYVDAQLGDIKEVNTSNVRTKNILEVEVINQNKSLGKIYDITSSLEQYEPQEVLFYAAEVLGRLMDSPSVAIYSVANRSFARLFSSTSSDARVLGNSVNYTALTDMYEEIKENRVYINKNMDEKYPLMASAIYGEEDMQLIMMVWGIPWERMTLGQANMLRVIGYLIQNAVVRANRYMDALQNDRYIEGTHILETEAFRSLVNAYMNAFNKNLTECTMLVINVDEQGQTAAAVKLQEKLRQSDSLGKLEDGRLYALLSNTPHKDAAFVIKRFAEVGYESSIWEEAVA
ncbi:nucleoside-diphosphate sugar epimerase [Clostridia bacterium]|nr:nucleoside-diphosphate sugar epimerase [Clostridia bacterium]